MLAAAAALLGLALGPRLARATVRLARRGPAVSRRRVVVTAAGVAAALAGAAATTGTRPALVGVLWVAGAAVVLAGVDLAVHRLPDVVTGPAVGVLLVAFVVDAALAGGWSDLGRAAAAAGIAFGGAALARLAAPSGLGFGDVKLLGLLGLLLGWRGWDVLVLGVFLGLLVGAVVSLVLLASRRAGWRTAIPFGPPLLVGAAAAWAVAGPL